jgi:uncharacterized membrane protein
MSFSNLKNLIYKPFNLLYLGFLVFLGLSLSSWFLSFFKGLLVESIGLPQEYFWAVMLLSLIGSYVNLPLFVFEIDDVVPTPETVQSFGVTYEIPKPEIPSKQTLVTINLGGAIIPAIISVYLLIFSIPAYSDNLVWTYIKTFVVLVIVTLNVHRSAQIVEGVGITTPAWGPPTMTVFVTLLVNHFSPLSCPVQIAYIGGTMGALIGADFMNLGRISGIGPVVSIGGAGTFDGVYLTGLSSVLILLFLS